MEKDAQNDEKMTIFVKFRKAIFGPEKQSPGQKSIKNKSNLPARGPQLGAHSGTEDGETVLYYASVRGGWRFFFCMLLIQFC